MGLLLVARQWHQAWIEQQTLELTYPCDACGLDFPEDELTETVDGEARLCNYCYVNEEYGDNLTEAHPSGPFFHASRVRFNPGDRLTPAFGRMSDHDLEYGEFTAGEEFDNSWVFFTPDRSKAEQYAMYGRGPYVYEVRPIGTIYIDPSSPFDMADQYVAEEAVIVSKVSGPGW